MPTTTMRAVSSTPAHPSFGAGPPAPVATRSRFLDRDGLDGVGHLLEGVGRRLELVDDLLELEHRQRFVLAAEELGQQATVDLVALVLETVDLDPVLAEVLHAAQPRHRLRGQ